MVLQKSKKKNGALEKFDQLTLSIGNLIHLEFVGENQC